jgi:hypothetical protein
MAVIGIRTEPSGRTRVLFDFSCTESDLDEVSRITRAMTEARERACPVTTPPLDAAPPRGTPQAASARRTSRPVTLPSRRRISAS